jgi:hypothetical protein
MTVPALLLLLLQLLLKLLPMPRLLRAVVVETEAAAVEVAVMGPHRPPPRGHHRRHSCREMLRGP